MVNSPSLALHPAAATGMAVKSRSDMTRVITWKQPAVPVYFQPANPSKLIPFCITANGMHLIRKEWKPPQFTACNRPGDSLRISYLGLTRVWPLKSSRDYVAVTLATVSKKALGNLVTVALVLIPVDISSSRRPIVKVLFHLQTSMNVITSTYSSHSLAGRACFL